MKKLILKLVKNWIYTPENFDREKMSAWLFLSHRDDGFKNYYTFRKKNIVNSIILEDDAIKRAQLKGRLEELKALAGNITEEYNRRKDKK